MTTWTREQLQQVCGLRGRAEVDAAYLARGPEAAAKAKELIARRIVDMAHPFAVELNPADVRFRTEDRDIPPGVAITGWWEPTTTRVEMRGGEHDGMSVDVRNAPWGDVVLALRSGPSLTDPLADMEFAPAETTKVRYTCSGWNETDRCWIYTEAGR